MCIIIDTNVLNPVFNKKNIFHSDFEPVLNWIFTGQGKIVYGGTKYLDEIQKYRKIFLLLNQINKAVYIKSDIVDELSEQATLKIVHNDFDDQHLVGLLLASKCKLICTNDTRATPFIQNALFFKSKKKPKIYHSKRNSKLLNPKNIAACCGECHPATKDQQKFMKNLIDTILAN